MFLLDPTLYEKAHLLILLFFTLYYCFMMQSKKTISLLNRRRSQSLVFIYAITFIVIVGLRPISYLFGDSIVYVKTYQSFSQSPELVDLTHDSLFYAFMWFCSQFLSVYAFFLIVEIFYVVPIILGCIRLMKNNSDIGLLFCLSAFSFYSYAVNGIRNGLALSLVLLAIILIQGNTKDKVFCFLLSIIAITCHASAALPVICMVAALLIKNPKWFFTFWILSILISLIAGNAVSNMFYNLGFDDRLSNYIHPDIEEDVYTSTGFRWDFILYSAAPIILGWYIIIKKKVLNRTYLLLLGTYILANAFWIMVIRAEFSNRFAYLSWFLYPIVLSYPLLKLKIWPKTQGRKAAAILALHYSFTFIMVFLLK